MCVGIVAIIPNGKNRTQRELIRKFGCVKILKIDYSADIGFSLPYPLEKELIEPSDEDIATEPVIY